MNNEEIRKKLIELSDAKYKEFHSGLCPGMDTEMLGVSIPKVRKLAKEIIKDNPAEYLKQPAEEYYEELLLQALVIANLKIELEKKKEYSPMMQHYLDTKKDYKDSILFYRLGDFYEMFFDDAILASRELELTLTGKECGQEERAPMCGVPFHAAENYIARLIGKGYKVAICEQMEDPKQAKGIVKREVIRVVTPGTVIESNLLDEKKNNYIMSVYKSGIYFNRRF